MFSAAPGGAAAAAAAAARAAAAQTALIRVGGRHGVDALKRSEWEVEHVWQVAPLSNTFSDNTQWD